DINNWVLYGLTDGVPQVPFAMVNFSRGSGAATFYSRPSWAGLIPWDNGNLNPAIYRPLTNNNFTTQVQINGGLQISATNNILWTDAGNAITRFYMSADDSFLRWNARGDAGDTNIMTVSNQTGQATFGSRPSFAVQTPSDTGNLNPNPYAVLNAT
ncbi:hypothetical protein ACUBIP_26295, partial [Escherichia coli]|uniref:hypothetical protein n=1 Tax=Escherichia coli TaxID=562 RepID=UPI00403E7A29